MSWSVGTAARESLTVFIAVVRALVSAVDECRRPVTLLNRAASSCRLRLGRGAVADADVAASAVGLVGMGISTAGEVAPALALSFTRTLARREHETDVRTAVILVGE